MTSGNGAKLDDLHDRLTDIGLPALGRNVMATNLVVLSLEEYERIVTAAELIAAARLAAEPYVQFFEDLDRNQFGISYGERGAGEGDWSGGNPFLDEGQAIGFGADGPACAYIVPPHGERGKIENWVHDLRGDA